MVLLLVATVSPVTASESLQTMLERGSALVVAKDLTRAQSVYQEAVRRFPRSRDARLGLARVLLWRGEYREARRAFVELLRRNARDVDARLGLAQAHYWSGDYRSAAHEFSAVLREQPGNRDASRALSEIRSASQRGFVIDGQGIDDDQPYRSLTSSLTLFAFSDPLTKWQVSAVATRLQSRAASGDAQVVRLTGETGVPSVHLTLHGSLGAMRFPDGVKRLLPQLSAETRISSTALMLAIDRRPLLRSAPAILSHPTAGTVSLRWSRENPSATQFAVTAEHLRYFDGNRGNGADAYLLVPVSPTLSIGGSVAYRDTVQSRFRGGAYDPYWTPKNLYEGRAIASAVLHRGNRVFGLHVDGGAARDRALDPQSASPYNRTFHPWRAAATFSLPMRRDVVLNVSAERTSTVFYTANEIRASVAGRF
jgi:hypothetical protein